MRTECGAFSVQSNKPAPIKLDSLPDLDVVACTNEEGSVITVFIVNRSLHEVMTTLDLRELEVSEGALLHVITGDSDQDLNTVFEPNRIISKMSVVPVETWKTGYALRPSSVYALEMRTNP
ncbi:hypothetical protein D3C81_1713760 [compost metagenome]